MSNNEFKTFRYFHIIRQSALLKGVGVFRRETFVIYQYQCKNALVDIFIYNDLSLSIKVRVKVNL